MKKDWKTILGDWDADNRCEDCGDPATHFAPMNHGPYDPDTEPCFCENHAQLSRLLCLRIGERAG